MTEQPNIQSQDEFLAAGVNIDPATWEEPKEAFPGEIILSEYRWGSDAYKAATQFRPAITDPLPQWDVRVKRLDAVAVNPDGSQDDPVYYGGIDLKKWSRRANQGQGGLVAVSSQFQKEFFITAEWKRVFGTIHPPVSLVGKLAMFDFYRVKVFGGSMPAKRVLVPTMILPPDYRYIGDKIIFTRREREDGIGDSVSEVASTPVASTVSFDTAVNQLCTEVLPGKSFNDAVGILTALPQELRLDGIVHGIADGALLEELRSSGRIKVSADGIIS